MFNSQSLPFECIKFVRRTKSAYRGEGSRKTFARLCHVMETDSPHCSRHPNNLTEWLRGGRFGANFERLLCKTDSPPVECSGIIKLRGAVCTVEDLVAHCNQELAPFKQNQHGFSSLLKSIIWSMEILHNNGVCGLDFRPQHVFSTSVGIVLKKRIDTEINEMMIRNDSREAVRFLLYCAPEIIQGVEEGKKQALKYADIWGFGCLALFILSEEDPQYYTDDAKGERRLLNAHNNPVTSITILVGSGDLCPAYFGHCGGDSLLENFFSSCFKLIPEKRTMVESLTKWKSSVDEHPLSVPKKIAEKKAHRSIANAEARQTSENMARASILHVDRFPRVYIPCEYTPVEELGWFALVNELEDPELKDYVADNDRRTLRKLYDHWRELRDFDLDDCWPFFTQYAQAFPTGNWNPLFNMRSWIQDNMQAFNEFRPDIVCSGGHLKYIMEMPNTVIPNSPEHAQSERFNYVACKRGGVIYLSRTKFGDSASASKKMYRMHRFEQLVTRTSDGTKENPALGMNIFEYSYSVFGRRIGRTRLLYNQKVDCIDPHTGRYVNLNVSEMVQPGSAPFCTWKEQNPTRAIWTRCFLGGSAGTLSGLQSNDKLKHCEWVRTEDIPDKSTCPKQSRCWYHWSKENNISFLNEFLEFIQAKVANDYESSVYGFLVNYSDRNRLSIEAVEWTAESAEFADNNILRKWGGEEAWNNA